MARTLSTAAADQEAIRLRKMYGCDIEAFMASVRSSPTMALAGPGMIAMSILSDAQEMLAAGQNEMARQLINRAKRVISDEVVTPFVNAKKES